MRNTGSSRLAAVVTMVLVATALSGCVTAVPGTKCDSETLFAGTDGEHVLTCPGPNDQIAVWGVAEFNEQPMTVKRYLDLLKLAAGPPTDVQRVEVLGDGDRLEGVISVDPTVSGSNTRPYSVAVTLRWERDTRDRPCNRVGAPKIEPELINDGVIVRVTWTERVGENRYGFCEPPMLAATTITDANGADVPVTILIP